jgi:DHA1 family bicyclomycin/chloramphenicol resistance-like MFS transporter
LAGLVLPLFVFVSANGFIVANSISGALNNFPQIAGSASALIGSMQYGSGIPGSALVYYFADGTPRPIAIVIAVCSVGSLLCTQFLPQPEAAPVLSIPVAEVPGPAA